MSRIVISVLVTFVTASLLLAGVAVYHYLTGRVGEALFLALFGSLGSIGVGVFANRVLSGRSRPELIDQAQRVVLINFLLVFLPVSYAERALVMGLFLGFDLLALVTVFFLLRPRNHDIQAAHVHDPPRA